MPSPAPSGVVNLKVFADGNELPGEFQVLSVFIHKELNRIPYAEISFLDGQASKQEFAISDKADLEPGKDFEVRIGYDTEVEPVFKGMIIRHSVSVRSSGSYTRVECKDKAVMMTIENHSEIYEKKKDSDIFKSLIGGYSGLSADAEATSYQHPQILQYDCTDWDFVVMRAELNGMLVSVADNKVSIKKPKTESAKLTLEFGTHIIDFSADVNADTQLSKVIATSWDIKNQEASKKEVTSGDYPEAGSLKAASLADKVKKDGHGVFHSGALDPNEMNEWGKAQMMKSKGAKLTGEVKCHGFANINPGDTLEIKGIGKKFNGDVFVSAVRHDISDGKWFTVVKFGLSPKMHAQNFDISTKQASGLIPAVHGLQIGLVTKIDSDPDNEHRIQVSLPVFGSKTNVWARKAFPDAGNKRGVYFMPEVGDEVIVGFLHDDARFPVVLGSLHSSKNATPYTTDSKNKEKGIVTRENLKITFDDVDKILTIETPAGQKAIFDDKKASVTINDKQGNMITLKNNMIELKGKGDINIEATKNITIKGMKVSIDAKTDATISATNIKETAKAQYKASGNAQAEISSGGQTTVKAGAMVQVQGALVKIN